MRLDVTELRTQHLGGGLFGRALGHRERVLAIRERRGVVRVLLARGEQLYGGQPGIDEPMAGGAARSTGLSATLASPEDENTIVSLFFAFCASVAAAAVRRPEPEPDIAGGGWLAPGRGGAFLPDTEDELGDGGRFGVVTSAELGADEVAGAAAAFAAGGAIGAFPEALAEDGAAGFAGTAVMGMSSGAFFTTKRTRASGSTAR